MRNSPALLQLAWALLLLFIAPVNADERILDFDSEITVLSNSEMLVTETITVRSEGKQIKRGIYRDFPTRYKDRYGNNYVVGFEVSSVQRDGYSEGWHTELLGNGVRIYMGRSDVYLSPGEYQYRLSYRTNRQLGFFDDHDELYWNVTGNGWDFPIDHASAAVKLPDSINPGDLSLDAYTGAQGAKGTAFESWLDDYGRASFETTTTLGPREGLTIAVGWPVGHITRPDATTKLRWFLDDNLALLIGIGGTLLVLLFYLYNWWHFGKDPEKGTIIPRFTPPENLSPAAMRYLMEMGFDDKALAAAVINMAVKGYLSITETDKEYSLLREHNADTRNLSPGEKAMALLMFKASSIIEMNNSNHERISKAIEALKKHLKGEYNEAYFKTNIGITMIGSLLTVATVIASGVLAASEIFAFLFLCVWLSIWSGAVIALWLKGPKFMAVVFSLFEIMAIGMLGTLTGYWLVGLIILLIGINGLFYVLMKAPTRRGRQLMDAIEGFKMYLATAESERLKVLHPPERTPELFEKYLPYALALGVEHEWAEQFSDVMARAAVGNDAYSPHWYHGSDWHRLGAHGFGSALGSSLGNAISSSSHAPGSSSGGGGGGFSGGGGGGGGGGGW